METNKRHIWSGIFLNILMLIFFSLIQRGEEQRVSDKPISSFCNSPSTGFDQQALVVPGTSIPETSFSRINKDNGNYPFPDCQTTGSIVSYNQNSGYFSSCAFKFLLKKSIPGLCFRPKIPGQENTDDPFPLI